MRKLFDDMPEELKAMLGIGEESSPTDLKGGNDFDYDNPPLTCEDIPDSNIPAEAIQKLVQVRKMLIEVKDMLCTSDENLADVRSLKLATSSPYAQVQFIIFTDEVQETLVKVNTLLHTHDPETGLKKFMDEEAEKQGITVKQLASDFVRHSAMEELMKGLLDL